MKTLLALLLLLLLPSCLEIDAQDVTLRYDATADRIDILLVHRGLFAQGSSGDDKDPLTKAMKDLADVREKGEFVFWSNWPFSVQLTEKHEPPIAALCAHVDVENGTLFTDPKGVLCGYQFVRIREAKAFLKKVNTLLELAVQAALLRGYETRDTKHKFDADTRDAVREFLRAGEPMLTLSGGRLELRLPLSPADHAWFKQQIEQRLLRQLPYEVTQPTVVAGRRASGGSPTETHVLLDETSIAASQLADQLGRAASFRFFWDNEFSIARTTELTTIGLGLADSSELHVTKSSDGLYHDLLLRSLRERGETIEDGLPAAELGRRFAQFHGRDAVLPPQLAEQRRGAVVAPATK